MHGQDDSFAPSVGPPSGHVDLGRPPASWSDSPPTCAAVRPEPPPPLFHALPEVGGEFLGFQLIAELGRGSFARVYLGRQPDLAGRLVALKVSAETLAESQKLAQLQHTHIVPVYSLHRAGRLQAVCMPYYGAATLADILHDLHARNELPDSGRSLVSTLEERRSRAVASIGRLSAPPGTLTAPSEPYAPVEAPANLRRLEGLSHVEAVLWIAACLADGLHHAHERGIVHRDVKPANVLLTDEGVPMLLDFNLADDVKLSGRRGVGGTLAYMAPEHLAAFANLPAPTGPRTLRPIPDGRSDIYSLGVILYELLTGRHPFGTGEDAVPAMIEERLRARPSARPHNAAVSPAVESILRRCLHPDPERRYQSALHLREDIDAHLDHLPLKHAPERSASEVLRKWAHRNPRLASTATLGMLAAFVLALLIIALIGRGQRLGRLDALTTLAEFRCDAATARLALAGLLPDDPARQEGEAAARRALALYGVLDGPGWEGRAANLPPAYREALRGEVGELLVLLANVAPPAEALRINEAAEACHPGAAVFEQRARLLELLGRVEEAKAALNQCQGRERCGPADRFLMARELAGRGRYADAAKALRAIAAAEPGHFAAWFLLGCCHLQTGDEADAAACFSACVAMRPDSDAAWRHRGIAHLRLGKHADADADLGHALSRRPKCGVTLTLRARAREGLGRHADALADLHAARANGGPLTRILLASARVKLALGDADGAADGRAAALKAEPADEEGWVARGVARVASDPRGALDDFGRAIALDPRSLPAWQNRAHVLAEHLDRPREAASALARVLEQRPGDARTRACRAVLLARAGSRAALDEINHALRLAPADGEVLYQAGCVHALLSAADPAGRRAALSYLARALARGFGHGDIDTDRDLTNLSGDDAFAALLQSVRALRRGRQP